MLRKIDTEEVDNGIAKFLDKKITEYYNQISIDGMMTDCLFEDDTLVIKTVVPGHTSVCKILYYNSFSLDELYVCWMLDVGCWMLVTRPLMSL